VIGLAARGGRLTPDGRMAVMQVARFHAAGDLRLEQAPEPVPGPGDLVVRVRNCSMCGTDLKIVTHGHHRIAGPRILGHEIAGDITQTEPGVTGGRCRDCAAGADEHVPRPADLRV
jgi:L-iditol 2-dehydrogenase